MGQVPGQCNKCDCDSPQTTEIANESVDRGGEVAQCVCGNRKDACHCYRSRNTLEIIPVLRPIQIMEPMYDDGKGPLLENSFLVSCAQYDDPFALSNAGVTEADSKQGSTEGDVSTNLSDQSAMMPSPRDAPSIYSSSDTSSEQSVWGFMKEEKPRRLHKQVAKTWPPPPPSETLPCSQAPSEISDFGDAKIMNDLGGMCIVDRMFPDIVNCDTLTEGSNIPVEEHLQLASKVSTNGGQWSSLAHVPHSRVYRANSCVADDLYLRARLQNYHDVHEEAEAMSV